MSTGTVKDTDGKAYMFEEIIFYQKYLISLNILFS